MRGRKPLSCPLMLQTVLRLIKKESPNEGTETQAYRGLFTDCLFQIKKESPNEGTETSPIAIFISSFVAALIKKESPNEGTETLSRRRCPRVYRLIKKESPNEGTETKVLVAVNRHKWRTIKKESPNEGTETHRPPRIPACTPCS